MELKPWRFTPETKAAMGLELTSRPHVPSGGRTMEKREKAIPKG